MGKNEPIFLETCGINITIRMISEIGANASNSPNFEKKSESEGRSNNQSNPIIDLVTPTETSAIEFSTTKRFPKT